VRGSVAQMVIERLDGTYQDRNEAGQYPLYNKVGCVVVTGNEDGAHAAAETTLFNLSHLGCTIPPNADTYWVGDAGPGPSYIEAHGEDHPLHQANDELDGAQRRPPREDPQGLAHPGRGQHVRGGHGAHAPRRLIAAVPPTR
jgi:multimeric flavodoxin WrbA